MQWLSVGLLSFFLCKVSGLLLGFLRLLVKFIVSNVIHDNSWGKLLWCRLYVDCILQCYTLPQVLTAIPGEFTLLEAWMSYSICVLSVISLVPMMILSDWHGVIGRMMQCSWAVMMRFLWCIKTWRRKLLEAQFAGCLCGSNKERCADWHYNDDNCSEVVPFGDLSSLYQMWLTLSRQMWACFSTLCWC